MTKRRKQEAGLAPKTSRGGALVRDVIQDVCGTSFGKPIQSGEFRKNPVEPAWICPAGYEYELIEREHYKMEFLTPTGVVTGRVILQLHGGGYIGPMKNIYRKFAVRYSKLAMGADVLTIDYRVAPEHPYPAALEDAVDAYRWLTEEKHYHPGKIVIAGDSAGGGLTMALVMNLRDHGIKLPAGLILMSPWADLTCSGESYDLNYENDPMFGNTRESMLYNSSYIGEANPQDPYLSPVFGSFRNFPPTLFQAGSMEMLLSDSARCHAKAKKAGCKSRFTIYEGMFHVFQMSLDLFQESRDAWEEAGIFLRLIYHLKKTPEGQVVRRVKSGNHKRSFGARLLASAAAVKREMRS